MVPALLGAVTSPSLTAFSSPSLAVLSSSFPLNSLSYLLYGLVSFSIYVRATTGPFSLQHALVFGHSAVLHSAVSLFPSTKRHQRRR